MLLGAPHCGPILPSAACPFPALFDLLERRDAGVVALLDGERGDTVGKVGARLGSPLCLRWMKKAAAKTSPAPVGSTWRRPGRPARAATCRTGSSLRRARRGSPPAASPARPVVDLRSLVDVLFARESPRRPAPAPCSASSQSTARTSPLASQARIQPCGVTPTSAPGKASTARAPSLLGQRRQVDEPGGAPLGQQLRRRRAARRATSTCCWRASPFGSC